METPFAYPLSSTQNQPHFIYYVIYAKKKVVGVVDVRAREKRRKNCQADALVFNFT